MPGHAPHRPIAAALQLPPPHVQAIAQSHQRCQAIGLSRIERPEPDPLARSDLALVRERNRRLHRHAAPVMEMLHEQIVDTQSMVVLCDAAGTILHTTGEADFLARASQVALSPGVNWSECAKGTNAIGTALIDEEPTLVHADEHYMRANQFLTCSAAPILDPKGNILGVLDVSGDHRSYHAHTMALVKMSARMIENHWLSDDHRDVMRLHFHTRAEFIGTLMEGIVAVGADGRIVGANRSALEQLRLSGASLRMHSLVSLFGTTLGAVVDHFRSPLATPLAVQPDGGRVLHLVARFNWPVWMGMPGPHGMVVDEAVAAAATPPAAAPAPTTAVPPARAAAPAPAPAAPPGLASLLTGDAQVAAVVDKVRRVLDRDIPVLILGETGTGKEVLARAMHADSARARQPFVAVNCASIPETLIEAELFGYEEGAFTGARRKGAVGRIVQAHSGTLFLDEIGDMPLPLQAHLLRVLQERQVTPLGSTRSVPVDVAIVCATHRPLREMIAARQFREDLYYRLNGLSVRLPALRERTDLAALVDRLLRAQCGGRAVRLSDDVRALFARHRWPGNVRQLFNVLRTAAVMGGADGLLTRAHLGDDFLDEVADPAAAAAPAPAARPVTDTTAPTTMDATRADAVQQALAACGGNVAAAARRLGVSRNTIYRRLRADPGGDPPR